MKTALVFLFTVFFLSGGSAAEAASSEYPGCVTLGTPLVDHTCLHASNGPFASTTAVSGDDFVGTAPNINAVHTYWTVTLSGSPGANKSTVKYRPARTGEWAVFQSVDSVPVQLFAPNGSAALPILLQHQVTCAGLVSVKVYQLTQGLDYRVVMGPAPVTQVALVLEKLSDFQTFYFRDADGDGFGKASDSVLTACVPPTSYPTSDDSDCDDTSASSHPGATEVCDGRDNDCDGQKDEGLVGCVVPVPALSRTAQVVLTLTLIALGALASRRRVR